MKILEKGHVEEIKILINEFIVTAGMNTKESIPVEFLKFLKEKDYKIQDGELLNDICTEIEKKCL